MTRISATPAEPIGEVVVIVVEEFTVNDAEAPE